MSIVNYYEYLPSNKQVEYYNPNACKLVPIHPCKILVTGKSGNMHNKAGKTNLVLNVIDKCNSYERFYLFVKMLGNDPLYDDLMIPRLEAVQRKYNVQVLMVQSNSLDDLPDVNSDEIDPSYQNLFIFDDMLDEDKKSLKKVQSYFTKMRKKNCSIIFVTQNYFETPKTIRKNCDYFFFTNIATNNELDQIYNDLAKGDIPKEKFIQMYQEASRDGHFLVDKNLADIRLKYRKNFSCLWNY